ncbi:hypothetical protein [Cohnella nanjingensis]|uniref:Uncharacterized protein n=1 Tax=Cohnella nanjingensis TaxID=1387779 RepID=A0A7X0RN77_9BACL|nr:hypothetical protein [Cohnella nanjingensis]MBB6669436.1 hypothetical protein [Cohnella nanjingensis]
MNVFAMEQLMMDQKAEIENQARHAWKWASLHHAVKTVIPNPNFEAKPVVLQVNPAAACCAACC